MACISASRLIAPRCKQNATVCVATWAKTGQNWQAAHLQLCVGAFKLHLAHLQLVSGGGQCYCCLVQLSFALLYLQMQHRSRAAHEIVLWQHVLWRSLCICRHLVIWCCPMGCTGQQQLDGSIQHRCKLLLAITGCDRGAGMHVRACSAMLPQPPVLMRTAHPKSASAKVMHPTCLLRDAEEALAAAASATAVSRARSSITRSLFASAAHVPHSNTYCIKFQPRALLV